MAYFSHRVVRGIDGCQVHPVVYNDNDSLQQLLPAEVPTRDSPEELKALLLKMVDACGEPVLDENPE